MNNTIYFIVFSLLGLTLIVFNFKYKWVNKKNFTRTDNDVFTGSCGMIRIFFAFLALLLWPITLFGIACFFSGKAFYNFCIPDNEEIPTKN